MSKANKRDRQRENRERAREERARIAKREKQWRTTRGLLILLVPLVAIFAVIALTQGGDDGNASSSSGCTSAKPEATKRNTAQQAPAQTIDAAKQYQATIKTSCGTMVLALDAAKAPIATNNFVSLARQGFYDGTTFHRAAKDFVIQGGDPKGDGSGGPGYTVVGEVPTDHYPVGSLAAAKAGNEPAGSFGSQFFIVTGKQGAGLPNDYARFGELTSGSKVAQRIDALAPKSGDGPPTKTVVIDKVTINET